MKEDIITVDKGGFPMKNGRVLLAISLLVMIGKVIAVPCLRADSWVYDIEDVFEALQQRHMAALHVAEIVEAEKQRGGPYRASLINITINQIDRGSEIVIPVIDAESSKVSVEYKQQDDVVFVHIPLQQGSFEVRFEKDLMQVEQKIEQKSDQSDAHYWSTSQSSYSRLLPMSIDPKSVEVSFNKTTKTLHLVFPERQAQQQSIKIPVKGLDDTQKVEEKPHSETTQDAYTEFK